uniref:Uncharacterized protein n=1 Tax=Trichogramma kaykai TaxID=54128 RepID=A0ABD2X4F9_9HYME
MIRTPATAQMKEPKFCHIFNEKLKFHIESIATIKCVYCCNIIKLNIECAYASPAAANNVGVGVPRANWLLVLRK